ncbi:MAG: phenylacetic acid degradation protein [Chloroflexota bacterium]
MTDTQWPRYIVFQQAKLGEPHQYAGSVHAPDAEMALLNARDVFVRRPACVSLWIVPAGAIFAKTAEELAENPTILDGIEDQTKKPEHYYVFQKATQKGTYGYVGDVTAVSADAAFTQVFETVALRSAAGWWVFRADTVTQSRPEDIEALFQPAMNKPFRDQAFYHTVAAMHTASRQVRTQSQDTNIDEP